MRKLTAGLFITLDGVTESPDKWQFDYFDADMMAAMSAYIAEEDAVLLGRRTYQEWAAYWPTANDEPYASHINGVPKYVLSSTLEKVEWNNSTLIKRYDALLDRIARLKKEPGKNIGVAGSATLVRSLLLDGVLDELTLMIHPVVAGRGGRLFPDGSELKRMRLMNHSITGSGVAFLTYEPAK